MAFKPRWNGLNRFLIAASEIAVPAFVTDSSNRLPDVAALT